MHNRVFDKIMTILNRIFPSQGKAHGPQRQAQTPAKIHRRQKGRGTGTAHPLGETRGQGRTQGNRTTPHTIARRRAVTEAEIRQELGPQIERRIAAELIRKTRRSLLTQRRARARHLQAGSNRLPRRSVSSPGHRAESATA